MLPILDHRILCYAFYHWVSEGFLEQSLYFPIYTKNKAKKVHPKMTQFLLHGHCVDVYDDSKEDTHAVSNDLICSCWV